MKSLVERQIDRAKRRAENSLDGGPAPTSIGAAAAAVAAATEAMQGLSPEDRAKLQEGFDGFNTSIEDDAERVDYAGIGITNPLIVPSRDQPGPVSIEEAKAAAGNGGGWPSGNANGRAVEAQAGASANDGAPSETPEDIKKREAAAEAAKLVGGQGKTTIVDKK